MLVRGSLLATYFLSGLTLTGLIAEPLSIKVSPFVRQHRGILVSEECSDVGCSRLTYPRAFLMHGMGLQMSAEGSPWGFSFSYATTDGSIRQADLTDTDVDHRDGPVKVEGPRIDLYKLHFRDTPYGYSGGHLWATAVSELKTSEYSALLGIERTLFEHWSLQAELDHAYSIHDRKNATGSTESTGREPVWRTGYLPFFGTYTSSRLALRIGGRFDYRLAEQLSLRFSFLPSLGIFSAKDARPESQRFYRSYTFGGGAWIAADLVWHPSSRFDVTLGFFQHRLYTKGNGEFYGSSTYYMRVPTPGWSVNLKEGGWSFGISIHLL